MKTHTVTTYDFIELKSEAQEKAIEHFRETEDLLSMLAEDTQYYLEGEAKCFFCLSYSQDDGTVHEPLMVDNGLTNRVDINISNQTP